MCWQTIMEAVEGGEADSSFRHKPLIPVRHTLEAILEATSYEEHYYDLKERTVSRQFTKRWNFNKLKEVSRL
jgi:hypothetical protein